MLWVWRWFYVDHEIERRPRGASRLKPLLHLLQRATVCKAMVERLWRLPKNRVVPTRLATVAFQAWVRCNCNSE